MDCPDCKVKMDVKIYRTDVDSDGYYTYESYIVQCPKCKRIEQVD